MKKLHPLGELCLKLDINHHKIKSRMSRHNGKVKRRHNIPIQILGWIYPIQKRNQLKRNIQ